jgi:hypothetical protein
MRNSFRSGIVSAFCIALGATAFSGLASAGPINMAKAPTIAPPSLTEQIYYRHYRGHYHHYRHYRRYGRYGYSPYYSPAGAVVGTAADVVTLPVRVLFGGPYGYPY